MLFTNSSPKFLPPINEEDVSYILPPPDSCHTSAFGVSPSEMLWEGQGSDEMDLEMFTEVMDGEDVDEDVILCMSWLIMHLHSHSSKLHLIG